MSMISRQREQLYNLAIDVEDRSVKRILLEAADTIEMLSEKAREPKWIPCSERLPNIGEKVLVSTKKTCFVQVFKGIYSDPTRWHWDHNSIKKIDAWMPLPKPYGAKESE